MSTPSEYTLEQEAQRIIEWAQPLPQEQRARLYNLSQTVSGRSELASAGEDSGVGNVTGRDGGSLPPLGVLASFGSWESVASTVLHKAEQITGFSAGTTLHDFIAWIFYRIRFSTIPFFSSYVSHSDSASISSLSLSPAISVVANLTNGYVTAETFGQIVTSIKKISQLAIENKGQTQKNSNLQQGVLSIKGGKLYAGTIRAMIQMEYKTGKGYQQLNQQITVTRDMGDLDFDMCQRNASILFSWDGRDVEDWVNDTASAAMQPNRSPAWG